VIVAVGSAVAASERVMGRGRCPERDQACAIPDRGCGRVSFGIRPIVAAHPGRPVPSPLRSSPPRARCVERSSSREHSCPRRSRARGFLRASDRLRLGAWVGNWSSGGSLWGPVAWGSAGRWGGRNAAKWRPPRRGPRLTKTDQTPKLVSGKIVRTVSK
jgi:hypothetical protein